VALSTFWKGALAVGAALGVGAVITFWTRKAQAPEMPACIEMWALHHGGRRDMSRMRLIVLHSTEGNTAAGAAGWFQSPASEGSAHIVVDDEECYRTLPDDAEPWAAKNANHDGLHIELAGHALDDPKTGALAYTREDWLSHGPMLSKAAGVIASWSKMYDIPLVFLDAEALKRGERGVTTHYEITKAYAKGMGHSDPGPEFPLDVFLPLAGGEAPEMEIAA